MKTTLIRRDKHFLSLEIFERIMKHCQSSDSAFLVKYIYKKNVDLGVF